MVLGFGHIPVLAVRSGQLMIYLQSPKLGRTGPRIPACHGSHATPGKARSQPLGVCEGCYLCPTGPPPLLQELRGLAFNLVAWQGWGGGGGYILLLHPFQDPLASMFLLSKVTCVVSQHSQQEAQGTHIQKEETRVRPSRLQPLTLNNIKQAFQAVDVLTSSLPQSPP